MKAPLIALLVLASGSRPALPGADPTPVIDAGALVVSRKAVDHIVSHETGGAVYYRKFYQRPQDPGFSSGVTVGFGYDLRYHTPAEIRRDWAGVATPGEIAAMISVAGLDGAAYKRIRAKVRITWDEARVVFDRTTLPRWASRTRTAYQIPGPKAIHPHLSGALVGNTFNRGSSMSGSRAAEKRQIRAAIASRRWSAIPPQLEAQQRLWPRHPGLKLRRREEAALAREALKFQWWQK